MKKIFLAIAVCAMMVIAATSCSKSTPDLLNEYREIGKEIVEATKNGDLLEIQSLAEKGEKIEKELNSRELSDEEKAEFAQIEMEIASQMAGATSDLVSKSNDVPFKGEYQGVYEGRTCTLNINFDDNTIESEGCMKYDESKHDFIPLKDFTKIKCFGTLDLYYGGYILFNILNCDVDEMEDSYGNLQSSLMLTIINQYSSDSEELIWCEASLSNDGKTVTLRYLNDDDYPLFDTITLKKVN